MMIKCEVIKEFTLERFDELKNIQRRRIATDRKLYVGDIFECSEDLAEYLMGSNKKGSVVVKVLEVIPEVEATIGYTNEPVEPKAEINIKLQKETKKTTKKKK